MNREKLHSQASPVAQLVKNLPASAGDVRDMDSIEESEKVDLKLNIQKTKIMASGPITSWQIDVETMETVTIFFLFFFFNTYSPSRYPLPPPSLPDPSGSSQCTRSEHLSHASSLGW